MIPAICAAVAIVLAAAPAASPPRTASRAKTTAAVTPQRTAHRAASPARRRGASALESARAQLAEVKRDPAKRRYRDRWERAIAALEKAARGRDRAPALLDAARARYALYRFSQVEADREAAVRLARKAERAGAREGAALARAIRKEMGDDDASTTRRKAVARGTAAPPGPGRAARPAGGNRPSTPERRETRTAPQRTAEVASAPRERPPRAGARSTEARLPAAAGGAVPSAAASSQRPGSGASGEAAATHDDSEEPQSASGEDAGDDEGVVDDALKKALAQDADPAPPAGDAARLSARVSELKTWSNHDYTRIAVYLSRSVEYVREELPPAPGQPRRIALDLRPAHVADPLAREVGDALVKRVRATQVDPQTVRVTLDLAGQEDLTVFALQDPPRLILDVGAAAPEPSPGVATAPAPREAPAARPGAGAAEGELLPRGRIRRVIVDAGHGGHDTGAIGPTGVREKDVTLAMARRLARRLEARGFEVVLTRRDDRYVALEERTAVANARHGDLFVSLHANAHPRRDRHGVETYFLNVADDRYAARLAARENGALGDGAADIPVLRRILSDLDAKVSAEASRRLARGVQREICAGVRGRVGEVRDLGVKSALFYVLLGARMPAVLVETGFISNRVEEARLRSASFQDEVAAAIVRAVDGFAAREARVASAR